MEKLGVDMFWSDECYATGDCVELANDLCADLAAVIYEV